MTDYERGYNQALADIKQSDEDHKRLVRELDQLLNGVGAAKQASLCDIVSQVRSEGIRSKHYRGNVSVLPVYTTLDVPADRVLTTAIGKLSEAVLVGMEPSGAFYFSSSLGNEERVLWNLERAKKRLMIGE